MHLIGTNLCVWLRIITIEIVRAMQPLLPGSAYGIGFPEAIGDVENGHSNEGNMILPGDETVNSMKTENQSQTGLFSC